MMRSINNWLDKPLTWREYFKDCARFYVAGVVGGTALCVGTMLVNSYKKKAVKTFEKEFEVERTEVVEEE